MKRMLMGLVLACALVVAVPAALGVPPSTNTLAVTPTVASSGDQLTFNGFYSGNGSPGVELKIYSGANCTGSPTTLNDVTHVSSHAYSFNETAPAADAWYRTTVASVTSNCVHVTIKAGPAAGPGGSSGLTMPVPPPPPSIFLCYSKDQDQPGVWPKDVAEQLVTQGYWLPYAISGEASGGTNLGGFHLACNPASTQSVSDSFVGGDGTELGPAYAGATIGLYPKIGG